MKKETDIQTLSRNEQMEAESVAFSRFWSKIESHLSAHVTESKMDFARHYAKQAWLFRALTPIEHR